MKSLLFVVFLFFSTVVFPQKFNVGGTLVDSETREVLESATVFIETATDSTLITYMITGRNGEFALEGNTNAAQVRLNVSYIGYENYQQVIDLSERSHDLGVIALKPSLNQLGEVVITSRAPIVIKRDTLEFNVSSFRTRPDATVEDLLKQLPGVEVAMDGTLTVNGKPVSEIMVNGKPFFGDDPTIATRNLSKEMIEKIQITDTKTDSEAFTGESGSRESKTINLTVKEDRNRGIFGRVAAGVGTDERYEYAGLLNYFDNNRRMSVLLGGNNINSPGFSFGEIREMLGRGGSNWRSTGGSFGINGMNFGASQGILESILWGANYADEITKGFDVSADYFHSGGAMNNETKRNRENILPDRRYFSENTSAIQNDNRSERVNMKFNIKIDSTWLIHIRPSFNYTHAKRNSNNYTASYDIQQRMTNEGITDNYYENDTRSFSNRLNLTKKYGSRGGFVRLSATNSWNEDSGDEYTYSNTKIFGENPSEEIRNQKADRNQKSQGFTGAANIQVPLWEKKLFVDFNYSFSQNKNNTSKFVNDFENSTMDFTEFNHLLSTDYRFNEIRNKPGATLIYREEGKNFRIGGGYVFGIMEGSDELRPDLKVENTFEALEMQASSHIKISSLSNINIFYRLRSQTPSIMQLLPSVDVSNPLHTIIGNPDLLPSTTQSLYAGYFMSNPQKGINVYFNLNGSLIDDYVVSKSIIDENNVRTTTYDNLDGYRRLHYNLHGQKKFKLDSIRSLTVGANVWGLVNRNVNFNNGIEYVSHSLSTSPGIDIIFDWNDKFSMEMSYNISFSNSKYDLTIFDNRSFYTQVFQAESSLLAIKNFEWKNSLTYNYNSQIQSGFQKDYLLWNTSVDYFFLNENASLSLKIYDLLDQNINSRRLISESYIEDYQSLMLQRYFMLSFSYKFNTMKARNGQAQ